MNKIYIIVPLIGMLLFGSFYYKFDKGYEAQITARKQKVEAENKAKKELDLKNREEAYKIAVVAAATRKMEREERERVEEKKKEDRLQAEERRQQNFDSRKRLREQVERLKKEVADVQAEVAKLDKEKTAYGTELTFLADFVKKAEANQKYYYDLIDKIAAADKAKADADAAAALVAKKNS